MIRKKKNDSLPMDLVFYEKINILSISRLCLKLIDKFLNFLMTHLKYYKQHKPLFIKKKEKFLSVNQ
jgi:hypothetical protein